MPWYHILTKNRPSKYETMVNMVVIKKVIFKDCMMRHVDMKIKSDINLIIGIVRELLWLYIA